MAAGQPCTLPGSVRNNPGPRATGTYMITAGGVVSATSGTSGRLVMPGQSSCRPDIAKAVDSYPKKRAIVNDIATETLQAGGVVSNDGYVVTIDGETRLSPQGVGGNTTTTCVNSRTTLRVRGDLYINGNVRYAGEFPCPPSPGSPSLGVIVEGNIYIRNKVTNLFGYYVAQPRAGSGGTINTCAERNRSLLDRTYSAADCDDPLAVRGILSASKIYFHRTTSENSGSVAPETITFTGQLYNAIPPGFGAFFTSPYAPQFQGSPSPRY